MKKQDEGIMAKFNLPKYVTGKTFAEASRLINDKFKGQNDKDSQDTLKELQGRLQQAQEYVKQLSEPNVPASSPSVSSGLPVTPPAGAVVPPANPAATSVESSATNQFFFGGGATGGAIGGGSSVIAGDTGDNAGVDGVKDSVASVTGPFGQLFRGIQKGGQKIGDGIGGEAGAAVADIFSPEESTIANFKDNDLNIGEKLLGTVPGLGGVIAKRSADKKARKEANYQTTAFNHSQSNRYEEGGELEDKFGLNTDPREQLIKALVPQDSKRGVKELGSYSQDTMLDNIAKSNEKTTTTPDITTSSSGSTPKFNAGALLRYAPAAMNALQLARLKKPEREGYDRINSKYNRDLVDEKSLQNIVNQDVANVRNKILNTSGGSQSAARANLLASQLQGTRALSDAYMKAEAINRGENVKAQDFNLNVAKTNLQQANIETQANAQNKGAYETQKSKLLAQLGNDLGGIGQEELFKKYPELMGMDYNQRGRYIAKIKAEEAKKKAKKK